MLTIHEGKESILNSFSCKCNHSLPCFCPSWWRPEKKQNKHPAFSCWHVYPDCGSQRMLIRGKYRRCPQEINAHTVFYPLFSQDVRVRDTLWKAWYRFCWKIFFSQLSEPGVGWGEENQTHPLGLALRFRAKQTGRFLFPQWGSSAAVSAGRLWPRETRSPLQEIKLITSICYIYNILRIKDIINIYKHSVLYCILLNSLISPFHFIITLQNKKHY